MTLEVLIWILIMMAIGLVVCTILFERITHERKQAKYDELHRSMGLGSHRGSGVSLPSDDEDASS